MLYIIAIRAARRAGTTYGAPASRMDLSIKMLLFFIAVNLPALLLALAAHLFP